jgi:hypothetical protein
MPDTFTIVRPDLTGRRPALRGFIIRCIFAAAPKTARRTVIEACKAEITWSVADYKRMAGDYSQCDGWRDGPHHAETYRLPHERAAARVLSAWGHLHPTETRIRANAAVLRSQIKAATMTPSWGPRAEATRKSLRLIAEDRARQSRALFAEIANYRRLRAEIESPTNGAPNAMEGV